jgi:hypothetical protein
MLHLCFFVYKPRIGIDGMCEQEESLKSWHPQCGHQVRLVRLQKGQVNQKLKQKLIQPMRRDFEIRQFYEKARKEV